MAGRIVARPLARAARGLALGLALAATGCGGGEEPARRAHARNVLLVTMDTTRADRLGCYGRERAGTPSLDRLAAEGLRAERCFSTAPTTLSSHATILTGAWPFRHGARNNGTHSLEEGHETLAETLAAAGFRTGAVVSAFVLDSRYGLDQGFATYDDDLSGAARPDRYTFRQTRADDTLRRARAWLAERGDERWFLWVHFFDPHAGYDAPPELVARTGDAYQAEIAFVDRAVGGLLDDLRAEGALDETLVVVTADHGESLGEHGESTHGMFVYDATTRVPLILRHPGLPAGRVIEGVTSGVDVAPTILDAVGVPARAAMDGRSLIGPGGAAGDGDRVAYSESMGPLYQYGWSDLRTLRSAGERFVRAPRPELYALDEDPREATNLAALEAGRVGAWSERLEAMLPEVEVDARSSSFGSMDADAREALADLGYVGSAGADEEGAARPDPKDRIADVERGHRANALVRAGRLEEARALLVEILERDPGALLVRETLADVLVDLGRPAEALAVLEESARRPGASNRTHVRIATLERRLGRGDGLAALARARELDPRDPLPWVREGTWALAHGDTAAARRAFERALELDERDAGALRGLGRVEAADGDAERALAAMARAVDADPWNAEAHVDHGVALEALGRAREAETAYERALELEPELVEALVNLANVRLASGDVEGARGLLERAVAADGTDAGAARGLARIALASRDARRAAGILERALAAHPDDPDLRRDGMRAFALAGRLDRSLECAEWCIARDAGDVEARVTAAATSAALGDRPGALEHLGAALRTDSARVRSMAARDPGLARLLEELEARE